MRVVLLGLLILTAAMAGCATKKGDDGGDDPSGTSTSTASGSKSGTATGTKSGTGTGGPAVVHTASLSAGIANGAAPLSVNFTINATGSPQAWTLAFGDGEQGNGTAFPATTNHTYTDAGLFTANLTVSFQDGSTLLRNVTVNVTAGGSVLVSQVPFSAEGTIAVGTQGDGIAVFDGCGFTETEDFAEHDWDLSDTVIGSGAAVTKIVAHMDLGETNVDSDIYLYGPDGTELGSSVDFNVISGSPTEDFEVAGPLAPGIYKFVVRACTGANASYSITATADVGAA